ncbi:MAG: hypothetical protein KAJ10_12230, partial [Thermodesulfovibrionia bacterium]|nr:hypothetical protein [Thermodesulfovibrionia bacterium]
ALDSDSVSVKFSSRDKIRMERFSKLAEEFIGIRYSQDGFDIKLIDAGWSEIVASISNIFSYLSKEITH